MSTESAPAAAPAYTFKNPFHARHTVNFKLTGPSSNKDTRHHEFSLAGSGISYLAGDALGVMPSNCPALADELVAALGAKGDELVPGRDNNPKPLRAALIEDYAITFADKKFLDACAQRGATELSGLLAPENADEARKYLQGKGEAHDYVEILRDFPKVKFAPEEFVKLLGKGKPRLYSIASSLKVHPEQVDLTVATVSYEIRGRVRKGVCSTFMAERWAGDATAGVWIQNQQKHFCLPANGDTPIIMVGPGTGVAPFRAYVEERLAMGAKGRNWLFFGEQQASSDFFYREQFETWKKDGHLRLETAFSRDQTEKVYVQHRMRECAHELWSWLAEGAEFFVCGDKERMAEDVHQELIRIVQTEGGKSHEEALAYVDAMKKEKRYKRDVY